MDIGVGVISLCLILSVTYSSSSLSKIVSVQSFLAYLTRLFPVSDIFVVSVEIKAVKIHLLEIMAEHQSTVKGNLTLGKQTEELRKNKITNLKLSATFCCKSIYKQTVFFGLFTYNNHLYGLLTTTKYLYYFKDSVIFQFPN